MCSLAHLCAAKPTWRNVGTPTQLPLGGLTHAQTGPDNTTHPTLMARSRGFSAPAEPNPQQASNNRDNQEPNGPRMPCQKYAETNSHHRRYRATPAPRAKGYQRRIDNTTNPTITPNSAVQTGHNRFCFRRTLSEDARVISKVKPPTIHITKLRAPLGAFSARTTVE